MKQIKVAALALPFLLLTSCAQHSLVTKAPHLTQAAQTTSATVQSSYPITISKNAGVGSTLGSIGGSIGGSRIGSGLGRYAGLITGGLIGGKVGSVAETKVREKNAQEVILSINGKSHKIITQNKRVYRQGDQVNVTTNVYGTPLEILNY